MKKSVEGLWEDSVFRWALAPLSLLYAAGWAAYESVYRLGWKKPYVPSAPTVCVGNLRVGGTGKTPFAAYVARLLESQGRQVAVSMSGYGSPASRGASLAPEGELDPARWGDEPALMREWLPDVPLIVGRDRVAAARLVESELPGRALVLDDGFQHLRLRCQASIVLDEPLGSTWCLPGGPYREPRASGLRRAGLVLPGSGIKLVRTASFRSPAGETLPMPGTLQVLTATAQPDSLLALAEQAGAKVARMVQLPDHDPLDAPGLWRRIQPGVPVLTTAKDWVKLRRRPDPSPAGIVVADYTIRAEPEEEFSRWLEAALDAPDDQAPVRAIRGQRSRQA